MSLFIVEQYQIIADEAMTARLAGVVVY